MSEGDTNAPKPVPLPDSHPTNQDAKPTLPQRLASLGILGGSAALGTLLLGETHTFDPATATYSLDPSKAGLVAGLATMGLSAYPLRIFEAAGSGANMVGRAAYRIMDRVRRRLYGEEPQSSLEGAAQKLPSQDIQSEHAERRQSNRHLGLGIATMGLVSAMAAVQHYVSNPKIRSGESPLSSIGKSIDEGVASLLGAEDYRSLWNDGQRNKSKNLYLLFEGIPSIDDICPDIPLPPQMSAVPSNATWEDYTHLKNAWKNSLEQWARGHPLALKWTATPATNLVSEIGYAEDPLYDVFITGLDNSRIGDTFVFYDGRLVDTTFRFKDLPHTSVSMYPTIIDDEFFITYKFKKPMTLEGGNTFYVRDVFKNKGYGPFIADVEEESLGTSIWDDDSGPQSPRVYVGRGGRPEDHQEMRFLYLINNSRDVRRIPLVDEE